MTPILSVRGLSKTFSAKRALNDVSFDLYKGEIVALLGLNGAGKSTALSVLTGKLLADEGEVSFHESGIIGFLPEGAPLFEDLSVIEQIRTLAGLYDLSRAERTEAIERVLTDFELSTVRKTAISALSKGFRRRVALAGAFLPKAPLLLLDEPTDGLDPAQRDRVLDQLRKSREDRTLLVSTHSLEDVAAICDRVLILTRGTLAFGGTLEALRQSANGDLKQAFLTLADGTEEITR